MTCSRQGYLPVYAVGLELILCCCPIYSVRVLTFGRESNGTVELDVMAKFVSLVSHA